MPMPGLRPSGRRRIVIIGNCQSETLRQGFARLEVLNRRFDTKYHFVQLQQNQRDFVARDLEQCDILLVQDVRDWDRFPLRDCLRATADVIKFPLVRFASLWPFDGWNGPSDANRTSGNLMTSAVARRQSRSGKRSQSRTS